MYFDHLTSNFIFKMQVEYIIIHKKKFLLNSSRHGHKSLVNQCSKLWTKMQNDLKDQDYFV